MNPCRTFSLAALAAGVCAAAIVTTASPGAAATTSSTKYVATWNLTGGVAGSLASDVSLVDYADPGTNDRVLANLGRTEALSVGGADCPRDSYGFTVFGKDASWANMKAGTTSGARVLISCLFPDGTKHLFRWGVSADPDYATARANATNCVALARTTPNTFTLAASDTCQAEEEVTNRSGQRIALLTPRSIPFSSSVVTNGTPPGA